MAFVPDATLDLWLAHIQGATELHLCTSLPADRAAALAASLGQKTTGDANPLTISAAADGSPSGRAVTIAPDGFGDGDVDTTGAGSHWALIDGTQLLLANAMDSVQNVTAGGNWSTTEITFTIPDGVDA